MEIKITNEGLFLAALVLAVGIAICGGGLYSVSESEKGIIYKVNRITGETSVCTPNSCRKIS